MTNFLQIQFFADASRIGNGVFFLFGFEASKEWLRKSFEPEPQTPVNPIKQALAMRQLLETPGITTKADIARPLGISRARVTQMLNLLTLTPEIKEYILALPEERATFFTERRLRPLTRINPRSAQLAAFRGTL